MMLLQATLLTLLPSLTLASLRVPFVTSLTKRSVNPQLTGPTSGRYLLHGGLGTPAQQQSWLIDTGSSSLWVHSTADPACAQGGCTSTFDQTQSSSFVDTTPGGFSAIYADGSAFTKGDMISETLTMGGVIITDVSLGLVNDSQGGFSTGIMGLGFGDDGSLPTFLSQGIAQGVFNRPVYSIWENSAQATQGEIVFDGVDTAKFTPPLIAVALERDDNDVVGPLEVPVTAFSLLDATGSVVSLFPDDASYPGMSTILDTGNPFGLALPPAIFANVVAALGAVEESEGGFASNAFVPCSLRDSTAKFRSQFGGADGPVIDVPISAFIDAHVDSTPPLIDQDGNAIDACGISGIAPTGNSQDAIFALAWQEFAYMVYDLENKVLALAQSVQGNDFVSNIVEVEPGNAIPEADTTVTNQIPGFHGPATTYTSTIATSTTVGAVTGFACITPTANLGVPICGITSLTTTTSISTSTTVLTTSTVSTSTSGTISSSSATSSTSSVSLASTNSTSKSSTSSSTISAIKTSSIHSIPTSSTKTSRTSLSTSVSSSSAKPSTSGIPTSTSSGQPWTSHEASSTSKLYLTLTSGVWSEWSGPSSTSARTAEWNNWMSSSSSKADPTNTGSWSAWDPKKSFTASASASAWTSWDSSTWTSPKASGSWSVSTDQKSTSTWQTVKTDSASEWNTWSTPATATPTWSAWDASETPSAQSWSSRSMDALSTSTWQTWSGDAATGVGRQAPTVTNVVGVSEKPTSPDTTATQIAVYHGGAAPLRMSAAIVLSGIVALLI